MTTDLTLFVLGGLLATGAALTLGYRAGRRVVPTDHIGIIRRRYGPGHPDPRFKKITPYDSRGLQARTLVPDRPVWLFPGLYTVTFVSRTYVPEGMVGLVSANEGAQRPTGRPVGRHVECDNFQDGQAFLLNGGEQGRQIQVLPGGTSYYNNYGSPYTTGGQYICPQVVMTTLQPGCGYACSLDSTGCRHCEVSCRRATTNDCRCAQTFRPVCGKDDITYINDCYADCADVDVRQTGVCH